jgi:hypothetical protein
VGTAVFIFQKSGLGPANGTIRATHTKNNNNNNNNTGNFYFYFELRRNVIVDGGIGGTWREARLLLVLANVGPTRLGRNDEEACLALNLLNRVERNGLVRPKTRELLNGSI